MPTWSNWSGSVSCEPAGLPTPASEAELVALVRQAAVPADLRARVAGSIAFLGQAAMLAGSVLGGLLGITVGPRATLVVGALGVLLAAPVVAVGPGLRRAGER